MGAVKEQSADVYAANMADRGFVTLAIDLSFWGESEGEARNAVAPDIYAEDFSAAVDFLGTRPFVDKNRIGIVGVCGSGSFVVSAAKIDPRMSAIATVSMYDMGAASRKQRYAEFNGGEVKYVGGTVHKLDKSTDPIQREFYEFYRTPRGEYTPKGSSPEVTTHPTLSSVVKFNNFYPFEDIETISPRPMLFITGDKAHSRAFSEDAYRRAAEPKELVIVPNAGHVDLYDRTDLIPFDKLAAFFTKNLTKQSTTMEIKRAGTQPATPGPQAWFSGTVRIDPLFQRDEPARSAGARVTFEPGARTAWHTHPLGQTLIVTSGLGRVQMEGGPIEEIRPGDVVLIPPGVRHWHGAGPTTSMTHIAIQEQLDGKMVDWMEHVSDEQYSRK